MKVRILPEAERDLEIGAQFYESQKSGLGRYFNDCLSSDIESLRLLRECISASWPLAMPIQAFSFAIFYEFDGETIDIYAVLDCRQDPERIEDRLRPL